MSRPQQKMQPKKPDFLIIGSAKCGTTALASILANHPDCCMSKPKEVSFFQDTVDFKPNPNFDKGWDWYQKAFSHYNGESVVGEATPSYSDRTRSPNTAKRIFEFNPDMKIIYMVRDPLQRQISGWKMQHAMGMANTNPGRIEGVWALDGFETWMAEQQKVRQWDECKFLYQLEAYLNYFPEENVFVSFLEDWEKRQTMVINECLTFLGLKPTSTEGENLPTGNSNRSVDRRIERPWVRKIRGNWLAQTLTRLAPQIIKRIAVQKLVFKPVVVAEPETDSFIAQKFKEYVRPDCELFLKRYSKRKDFWPSLVR